ncbi:MAG TPA: glycosyltransferase family 2 protein [Myxococcales bacterium]|nr:glycosyltransferase family 2 protein [Myxococcales bacterium]
MSSPSVSVIILAYNEADNLGPMLRESLDWLVDNLTTWELLVVDDGSTDNTCEVAASFAAEDARVRVIVHDENRGMGAGMKSGILAATCDYFTIIAGDGQHPTPELGRMLPHLLEADIVTTYHENQREWPRRILSWGFRRVMQWACGINFILEGIYLFPRKVAVEDIGLDVIPGNTFFFSFELIARALRRGHSLTTCAMIVRRREHGQSKVAGLGKIRRIFGEVLAFRQRLKNTKKLTP